MFVWIFSIKHQFDGGYFFGTLNTYLKLTICFFISSGIITNRPLWECELDDIYSVLIVKEISFEPFTRIAPIKRPSPPCTLVILTGTNTSEIVL